MAVVASERSLRDMASVLYEFEGPRCLWRVPIALATYAVVRGLPIVAAIALALVTVNGRVAQATVSAVVALLVDGLGKRLRDRFPWKSIVAKRLWTYEAPNPATEVPVLVRSTDAAAARSALRPATFNPQVYGVRLGSPPADAPDLDFKIAVHEPAAWPQSGSDDDRVQRIARVLSAARIHARVAGTDVVPPGDGDSHDRRASQVA